MWSQPPQFQPRIRREDTTGAAYTYFTQQLDPEKMQQSRPFMDMAPINSRTDTRDVRQSQPYVPKLNNSATMGNPYFQKFDITQDPRNVARELQGVVYEDRSIRGQTNHIAERSLQQRWIPPDQVKTDLETMLKGRELTQPQLTTLISRTSAAGPGPSAR